MKNILVVTRRYGKVLAGYRWNPYLFPLWYFSPALRERGIRIEYNDIVTPVKGSWDAIFVDNKAFRQNSAESILQWLEGIRNKAACIVWLDNGDSGGTTQFEVLPYVDYYAKRQIYKQRSLYRKSLYGQRAYTDFYHNLVGVSDLDPIPQTKCLSVDMEDKLVVSWNFALADYRWHNRGQRYMYGFTRKNAIKYRPPEANRSNKLFSRFSTKYDLESVSFQRQMIKKELHDSKISLQTNRVSRTHFMSEMRNSLAVMSPFGWGELCLRDFEAWISGCALIKPDVSHLETWPDIFKAHETYFPLSWDINKCVPDLQEFLANPEAVFRIAEQGQSTYKAVWSPGVEDEFCRRIQHLITI